MSLFVIKINLNAAVDESITSLWWVSCNNMSSSIKKEANLDDRHLHLLLTKAHMFTIYPALNTLAEYVQAIKYLILLFSSKKKKQHMAVSISSL